MPVVPAWKTEVQKLLNQQIPMAAKTKKYKHPLFVWEGMDSEALCGCDPSTHQKQERENSGGW